MNKRINLAVVGATGLVGEAVLAQLAARGFKYEKLYLLAGPESVGTPIEVGDKNRKVAALSDFDFKQAQLAIFCVPAQVSREFVPQALHAGCAVIDHSSAFRLEQQVPLIIPEVNAEHIAHYREHGLIACPASPTVQALLAAFPLQRRLGVRTLRISTYLAVSSIGKSGLEELSTQTVALLNLKDSRPKHFAQQIAFNLIPQSGQQHIAGLSHDEWQMKQEIQKILGDPDIRVIPMHVQAPVFFAHSQVLDIETKGKIPTTGVQNWLSDSQGIVLYEGADSERLPTAVGEAARDDHLYIGRLNTQPGGQDIRLWSVADNLYCGAARGSVQVAEILVKDYL